MDEHDRRPRSVPVAFEDVDAVDEAAPVAGALGTEQPQSFKSPEYGTAWHARSVQARDRVAE